MKKAQIMKNKKMLRFRKASYLLIILSVISGFIVFICFGNEIGKNSANDRKQRVNNNAYTGKAYFEQIIKERINGLEILAGRLSEMDMSNRSAVSESCKKMNPYYDDISIVDENGIRIYGNCLYKSIYNSDGFEKALKGMSNVATEVTANYLGKDELCFFVPINNGSRVKMVVVGSMLLGDLNNILYNSGLSKDGHVVILSDNGDVIAGTRSICDLGMSLETNIFSYLNECKMLGDIDNQKVRNSIKKKTETNFEFKRNKKNYIVTTLPTSVNKWEFMYISKGRYQISDMSLSKAYINYIRIFLVELFVIMFMLIYAAKNREKLLLSLKTYDEVSKIDKTIIFEYNFLPKCFELKDKYGILIDKEMKPLMGEAVYDVYEYVHPDDLSIRSRVRKFFESDETFFSSEVRICNKSGEYDWYRISGCVEREKNGSPIRFVGKLTDASKQISMEKNLVQRAENDMLTGVLNKKTMEEKMSNLLVENKSDRYYIFYMVDLDNFKNVNDTLGHIYGDKAIADTGAELSKIFKRDALIGRLGGDEFAVCSMYDAFDNESLKSYIIKKAEQISNVNRRSYTDGVNVVNITSSIGVSVAPIDGNDFETIYKKADSALYQSKKSGKDRYTIFSGELWKK